MITKSHPPLQLHFSTRFETELSVSMMTNVMTVAVKVVSLVFILHGKK